MAEPMETSDVTDPGDNESPAGSPEVEAISPDVEAVSPDNEAKSPDVEAMSPDVEAKSPDVEAKSPDVEDESPEIEAGSPEVEDATEEKTGDGDDISLAEKSDITAQSEMTKATDETESLDNKSDASSDAGDLVMDITPDKVASSPAKTPPKKSGTETEGGEGSSKASPGDDDVLSISDDDEDESRPDDRLLSDPVDREVEAGDVDVSSIKDGELQNRSGRTIKKPNAYSPDHEYGKKKRPTPNRIRRSGSSGSGQELLPEGSTPNMSKVKKRNNIDPKWLLPFNEGWRRELVLRNTYDQDKGTRPCDIYYYPPDGGAKQRSGVQIGRYLEKVGNTTLSVDCFTFIKDKIFEEPGEFVRSAGRHSFGRPKTGSPSKSPKTPVMKQKKSPFVKSPLTLKKNAILTGLVTSPQSPKMSPMIIRLGNKTLSPDDRKFTIVRKDMSGVEGGGPPKLSIIKSINAQSALPKIVPSGANYIKITPTTVDPKRPVAKKHTGKRSAPGDNDPGVKKIRIDTSLSGPTQKLCGMDCPGRHGVPPSLHCTICMCMFHPECVGKGGHQVNEGFVCKACKTVNKNLTVTKKPDFVPGPVLSIVRTIAPRPPPLQVSSSLLAGTVSKDAVRVGGPPPLRAAPNILSTSNMRQPPPLRMAPQSSASPSGGQMIQPPPLRPNVAIRTNIPISVLDQSPVNGVPGLPPLAPAGMRPVVSQPPVLTIPPKPMNVPPPINVTLPPIAPKEVSGQILALPSNVTGQLDMDKPVALKVNGQRYIIPPHCFINTQEGAKIYLPPGYLPSNTMEGPAKPLSINLNASGKDEQMIKIAPYSEQGDANGDGNRKTPSPITIGEKPAEGKEAESSSRKTRQTTVKNMCHIQQLHVGFDCMLYIFEYLNIKDILRAKLVCKTWRRVATQHCIWRRIQLRGCQVTDWELACKTFRDMHTQTLDLRGLIHPKDTSRTWHQLTASLPHLVFLRCVDLGQCPSNLLHAITEKVPHLTKVTAEFITDNETDMWSTNARLDVGKFSVLRDLEVLRLRGVCGLVLPAFSFSGGLTELCALTNLRRLSLTTLRDVAEDEFTFLTSLSNLEELELGDLSSWKPETYNQLSSLENLRFLRLECGVDHTDGGLGEALLALNKLETLELIKFAVSTSLVQNLGKVSSLRSLSIWPDTEHKAAFVNTCTLRAVSGMTSLRNLDWGIMIDTAALSGNQDDEDSNGSGGPSKRDCVPVLAADAELDESIEEKEENLEYLSIAQLVDRLSNLLPDTKIRVFKVPVISPKAKAAL